MLSDFKLTQQIVDYFILDNEVLCEGSGENLDDALVIDDDDGQLDELTLTLGEEQVKIKLQLSLFFLLKLPFKLNSQST